MTESFTIRTDSGAELNATLEFRSEGIIFHSRSGTDRNRDYRPALELLLRRLDQVDISYDVYLDSRPVQHIPLAQRRLLFDREAPISTRFDQLVRAMNAESASRGAWRRLLIATPGRSVAQLIAAVDFDAPGQAVERLPALQLRQVTSMHIHSAVSRLRAGEDASNFASSRDYDVLTDDGVALAPKKVFGLALEEALGIEAHPGHFSAGWNQVCFELLEKAGLWIVPKAEGNLRPRQSTADLEAALLDFAPTDEERSWIEGNIKIVSHLIRERRPGLANRKRAEFIAKHGRLFCEECKLDPVEIYGSEAGHACIEVHHHRVHVANMSPGHLTATDDLKCLCANCHRVLHRKLTLGLAS